MKKLLVLLLTFFALNSCEKDAEIIGIDAEKKLPKVDVCHKSEIINISENALKAHLNHGDVQLIDKDGDGYVTLENECLPYGDCDDTDADINPGAEEICGDGIDNNCDGEVDEGCDVELAIGDEHEGGLIFYIDETGEHGLIIALEPLDHPNIIYGLNWGDAMILCDHAVINGFDDWYLPSLEEMYLANEKLLMGDIMYPVPGHFANYSWTSTELDSDQAFLFKFDEYTPFHLWLDKNIKRSPQEEPLGAIPIRAF